MPIWEERATSGSREQPRRRKRDGLADGGADGYGNWGGEEWELTGE